MYQTFNPSRMFQSSPNPKAGCNDTWVVVAGGEGFQSSPNPKAGCNRPSARETSYHEGFNPRPTRRLGATKISPNLLISYVVSILTQPEGWVQLLLPVMNVITIRFNPHPTRRLGATGTKQIIELKISFQSSPNPKAGCNTPGG